MSSSVNKTRARVLFPHKKGDEENGEADEYHYDDGSFRSCVCCALLASHHRIGAFDLDFLGSDTRQRAMSVGKASREKSLATFLDPDLVVRKVDTTAQRSSIKNKLIRVSAGRKCLTVEFLCLLTLCCRHPHCPAEPFYRSRADFNANTKKRTEKRPRRRKVFMAGQSPCGEANLCLRDANK
jgi:hypothetical protein